AFTLQLYAGELRRAALRKYTNEECQVSLETERAGMPELGSLAARVLVVEDVELNQRLLAAVLRRAGATVDLASDGRQGMDLALAAERRGEPHDVVLMDMQMPVMDGYAAARALRAAGYRRPIIAL